ncbi:hypothetical protein MMC06_004503 [Schaereria dolodes]|nr:hypothetical protein [Schaereria dolodes]
MASRPTKLILYAAPLSGCSARIRIAAHLKKIPLLEHEVIVRNVGSKEGTQAEDYLRLNPNAAVPTLVAEYSDGKSITVTQSLAILEFLEESYTDSLPLLPPLADMSARTKTRALAALVACDIQPLQTIRIRRDLEEMGHDPVLWAANVIRRGLKVYNEMLGMSAGKYSVGDKLSIADICLFPTVQSGHKVGVDLEEAGLQNVSRIFQELKSVEGFSEGGLRS